jgi:MFS family permease
MRWKYWVTASLLFLLLGVQVGVWGSQLPAIQEMAGLSVAGLGLSLSALAGASILAAVVTGRYIDRAGTRVFAVGGIVTAGGALVGIGTLPIDGLAGLAWFLLFGVGVGAFDVAVNATGSNLERMTGAKVMIGLHAAFSAGAAFSAAVCAVFLGSGVPSPALLLGAGCLFLVVGPALLFLPVPSAPTYAGVTATRGSEVPARVPIVVVLVAVAGTACFFGDGILQSFGPVFFADYLAGGATAAAIAVAVFQGASFAGRVMGVAVLARVRHDNAIMVWSAFLSAVAVLAVALSPGVPVALVGMGVAGLCLSPLIPTAYSTLGRLSNPGRSIAALTSCGYAAFSVAPAVAGVIAQASSLVIPLLVAAAAYLISGTGALFTPRQPDPAVPVPVLTTNHPA